MLNGTSICEVREALKKTADAVKKNKLVEDVRLDVSGLSDKEQFKLHASLIAIGMDLEGQMKPYAMWRFVLIFALVVAGLFAKNIFFTAVDAFLYVSFSLFSLGVIMVAFLYVGAQQTILMATIEAYIEIVADELTKKNLYSAEAIKNNKGIAQRVAHYVCGCEKPSKMALEELLPLRFFLELDRVMFYEELRPSGRRERMGLALIVFGMLIFSFILLPYFAAEPSTPRGLILCALVASVIIVWKRMRTERVVLSKNISSLNDLIDDIDCEYERRLR